MSSFTTFLNGLRQPRLTGRVASSPPRQLLERADARAGQDPHQASELRQAALDWLRVVR
ncbi:MAG: hypothetical protein ACXWC6_08205 [Ramlibacter sp.]